MQLKKHRVSSSVFKEVLDSLKSKTTRAAKAKRDTELVAVHAAPMGGLSNSDNTSRIVNVIYNVVKMRTTRLAPLDWQLAMPYAAYMVFHEFSK